MRWWPLGLLLMGCDDPGAINGIDLGAFASAQARAKDPCTVRFKWLQKDAYKETAGRSTDLWPPHTTTQITATCTRSDGATDRLEGFMANHGTAPGERDVNGDVFLVKTEGNKTSATRGQVKDLLAAYEDCECGTEFLTLEAIDDAVVQSVMDELVPYLYSHLECGGDPQVSQVVDWLAAGDIESVVAALPGCVWTNSGLELGLDEALAQAVGGSLSDYHVCNNDAVLQADLWERFREEGQVRTCEPDHPACSGPLWLYTP